MHNKTDCLIIGCGDIGKRILTIGGDHYRRRFALIHNTLHQASITALHAKAVIGDLDKPTSTIFPDDWSPENTVIFYLAPPPLQGEHDTRMYHFLSTLKQAPAKLIYISTSGIYGDRQGNWVDESAIPAPATERAKRRLSAEQQLLHAAHLKNTLITILRVPGIYGPGRLPLDKIRQGEAVIQIKESPYTNLIHADDLARICISAATSANTNSIYNVSDGTPLKTTDYYYAVADLANLKRPPVVSLHYALQTFSHTRLSFLRESRRLNVEKMHHELKPELLYRNFKHGIQQTLNTQASI